MFVEKECFFFFLIIIEVELELIRNLVFIRLILVDMFLKNCIKKRVFNILLSKNI